MTSLPPELQELNDLREQERALARRMADLQERCTRLAEAPTDRSSFAAIALGMGISETRARQIYQRAITKTKARLLKQGRLTTKEVKEILS